MYLYLRSLSTSRVLFFSSMLMRVCPGGTEGSGREASLSSSSLCQSAWRCFKLEEERRKDGREQMKEGRGEKRKGREGRGREREGIISYWAYMNSSIRDEVLMANRFMTSITTLCVYNALTSQGSPLCGTPPFPSSSWSAVSPAVPWREAFSPGMHVYAYPNELKAGNMAYMYTVTCNISSPEVLKKRGNHLKLCTLIISQFLMHNTIL